MARTDRSIRHLAFYETLGALDDHSAAWRAASAGLIVLRLVDDWLAGGDEGPDAGRRAPAVRETVARVDESVPARRILLAVVDAIAAAPAPDSALVTDSLMAYARSLDGAAESALARDAYAAVVEHAHPVLQARVAIDARIRVAYWDRLLGRVDEATAGYARAERLAQEVGDLQGALMAQLGFAKIAVERGNLPDADRRLERAIRRARAAGLQNLESRGLHERGGIALLRGENERAARLIHEALERATEPRSHDRLLGDLGMVFNRLGLRAASRDAQSIVAATAVEQTARWTAMANLMELASLDGQADAYESYRRELGAAPLPPMLAAQFMLHVGQAEARAGRAEAAAAALRSAIATAERHRFHQVAFLAEESLAALTAPGAAAPAPRADAPTDPEPPDGIRDVVEAVAAMRRGAGVAPA